MKYNKVDIGPIIPFILFLLGMLAVCIVGVSNVFAATYSPNEYYAELYNNLGPTLNKVNTYTEEINGEVDYYYGFLDLTGNSAGGAWIISSPIPIIDGHTYSMTINTYAPGCGTTTLSTYNRIGLGSTINWAKTSFQENTLASELYSKFVNNTYLQYVFKAETNASYIAIPFATTLSCTSGTVHLKQVIIDDLGTDGITESTINNSLTNQTNELNSSIQESTDTITGAITDTESNINSNIDDMESAIIDSNKETQEVIKDQFNECHMSYNLFNINNIANTNQLTIVNDNAILLNTLYDYGAVSTAKTMQDVFNGEIGKTYYLNFKTTSKKYNYIYLTTTGSIQNGSQFVYTEEMKNGILYFYGEKDEEIIISEIIISEENISYEPYGEEICSNKIDETNDKLDNLQGALTDDSSIDMSSLGDTAGWLPAGPVDSIINIPLTLLNALSTSLSGSCVPLTITIPFVNKSFTFPCMSELLMKIDGFSTFWSWLGAIASVIILYKYLMNLYAWVDNILMMRVELDEAMGCDMANWGRL